MKNFNLFKKMTPSGRRFIRLTAIISFFTLAAIIPLSAILSSSGEDHVVEIDLEECVKCNGCVDNIPEGTLIMLEDGPAILVGYNFEHLKFAADICPVDAIKIVR
ncbi:MAG: ferredoxin [Bacteroidales bacterium]